MSRNNVMVDATTMQFGKKVYNILARLPVKGELFINGDSVRVYQADRITVDGAVMTPYGTTCYEAKAIVPVEDK
jgi:hypothetical protein